MPCQRHHHRHTTCRWQNGDIMIDWCNANSAHRKGTLKSNFPKYGKRSRNKGCFPGSLFMSMSRKKGRAWRFSMMCTVKVSDRHTAELQPATRITSAWPSDQPHIDQQIIAQLILLDKVQHTTKTMHIAEQLISVFINLYTRMICQGSLIDHSGHKSLKSHCCREMSNN